jgi:sortase A
MVLRTIGRIFIAAGLFILLFLAYQLFGTNVVTERNQKQLARALEDSWAAAPAPTVSPTAPQPETAPSPAAAPLPDFGSGIALIQIPKIEVDRVVVEGTGVDDLKKGPGHYRGSAYPGQRGNVVISGHRTTYGAPFYRLNEIAAGDEIRITTREAVYVYRVLESRIVAPTDLSVVVSNNDARLTLTTCHPRFSARQRLIIVAELAGSEERRAA